MKLKRNVKLKRVACVVFCAHTQHTQIDVHLYHTTFQSIHFQIKWRVAVNFRDPSSFITHP